MDSELKLKEGDPAPNFTVPTSGGTTISLSDFRGKFVVLYFYPKDNTPGCNKEACGFRDAFGEIQKQNTVILGVSTDSVKSHDKFAQKFRLPFTLVSDEDKSIAKSYGVYGEKSFLGRLFLGTRRTTFLIGPDGTIRKIWPKVKVTSHAEEVLAAIKESK
jgi:peroxiredoxin Q/BCP